MHCSRVGLATRRTPCMPAQGPALVSRVRTASLVCRANGNDDPYKILGIEREADSAAIEKAYRVMKSKHRYDSATMSKIERAHDALMLSALSQRTKSAKAVPKEIRYADTEPLFPWRPKRWDATPKVVGIVGALQLGMIAFGFQSPSTSKIIGCMLIGIAGNVMKQNAIFPPPAGDAEYVSPEEEGRAGKNFVRGVLLAIMATFAGVLIFSAPEYLAAALKSVTNVVVPPNIIVSVKIAGSALTNWVMTSFYY